MDDDSPVDGALAFCHIVESDEDKLLGFADQLAVLSFPKWGEVIVADKGSVLSIILPKCI
jgi:hypothetical protein